MCKSCIDPNKPDSNSYRWIAMETKQPGSRPKLWVRVNGEVLAAENADETIIVDGVAVQATHWMVRA